MIMDQSVKRKRQAGYHQTRGSGLEQINNLTGPGGTGRVRMPMLPGSFLGKQTMNFSGGLDLIIDRLAYITDILDGI